MIYLIFAIISSATLTIALKIFRSQDGNKYGLIIGNYLTCILISFLLVPDKGLIMMPDYRTVLCGLVGGVFFVLGLVTMQQSVLINGASLSSAFAKLGVLVSLSTSIFIFGERPTALQALGMIIVLGSIILINSGGQVPGDSNRGSKISVGLLLITLIFGGLGDSMAKVFQEVGRPQEDTLYFLILFIVAEVISLVLAWRESSATGNRLQIRELAAGLVTGIPNYFSSYLVLLALSKLPAFVVYSAFSTGTILLVTIISTTFFKEKLTKRSLAAMALIVVALLLLQ